MLKQICYKNGCEEIPDGFCDCEKDRIYFCLGHMNEHFMIDSGQRHKFYDIKYSNYESRIEEIFKIKSSLNLFKRKALYECANMIKQIKEESESVILKIEKLDLKLNSVLSELFFKKSTLATSQNPILESNWSKLYRILDFDDISNSIENQPQISEKVQPDINHDFDNYSSSICFFQNKTKNLVTLNLNNLELSSNSLNIRKNIDRCISMCQIPNKIFCYGNFIWWYDGLTFIIDEFNKVQLLPSGKKNCFLKIVYFNSNIYAFGGDNNLAEKFNLCTSAWETCASLPKGNFQHSYSVEYNNEIILTGYSLDKLFRYNIDSNVFTEAAGILLQKEIYKMLISAQDKLYIVEASSKIYECKSFDLSSWNCIGINLLPIYSSFISYSVNFKGKEYFINEKYDLWEFDLKLQTFKLVKKLNF
ncbi:unnamed protein product [Blepharisma stoltei]|uniref:Uncharacterized protein n=1 Tax=Blepharisma stoltei TaxID=1481888 RepID=A0AAU9J5U6_9CILI|nr:unnamed protein product [Blepharisma stoltei]